jgi:hypothetical protein
MASLSFQVLDNTSINPGANAIGGSGLGFYGNTFGASVATTSYQDSTFVTNSDGNTNGGVCRNVKYLGGTTVALSNPTGCYITPAAATSQLLSINGTEATLVINFNHSSSVKVQNCQLRIYDRVSPDRPATGVITKVAEIVNFMNVSTYDSWASNALADTGNMNYGFGDAFWWGSPWPSGSTYFYSAGNYSFKPFYVNSVGVTFQNFTDLQASNGSGNPDSALAGLMYPAYETVGGSGLVVPLLDSPGSGGRFLHTGVTPNFVPKYTQYVVPGYQTTLGKTVTVNSGVGGALAYSYGGTGYDTCHTWRVALSARPLSIGSKTNYGLYVSLEYL